MADNTGGSVIALIPLESDPISSASSEKAHMTLAWLGEAEDLDDDVIEAIRSEVKEYASQVAGTISASVESRGELGDEGADVVFLEGDGIRAFRDGLVELPAVEKAMARVEQYPEWTPHVTMGYPDTPAIDEYDGEQVTFDRLSLWVGEDQDHYEFEEGPVEEEEEQTPEAVDDDSGDDLTEEEIAEETESLAGEDPVPIHGVLAPIEAMSGDNRIFSEGAITHRDLPLPMKWMKADGQGHDNSVVVANIEQIKIVDGLVLFAGFMASNDEAAEVIALRAENALRGVSVDLDQAESVFENSEGKAIDLFTDELDPDEVVVQRVTAGRIAAATICAIPAFQEAYFDLGTWDEALDSHEECVDCDDEEGEAQEGDEVEASAETFAPGTKDGPGWITHPIPTSRIRRYWVKGKGAAKIGWGAPGDFNRCRSQLAKYIKNPQWLAGTCANMHKEALGIWPGQHSLGANTESQEDAVTASAEMDPAFRMVPTPEAIVAAAGALPKAWFENPELTGPTPMTITEDGQIYGHAATWNECHIGVQDKCVTAPRSLTNYAYFHTGEVQTDSGPVAVGPITMSTGHADLKLGQRAAVAHYDDTGTVIADVRMGEDAHGIWFSGAVRSSATEEQIHSLRAAAVSGDWRPIGAGLEFVAALAVNTPGFPIPRTAIAASGADLTALVAAAPVQNDQKAELEEFDMATFARTVVKELKASEKRRERMQEIHYATTKENRKRRESVLARVGEDN